MTKKQHETLPVWDLEALYPSPAAWERDFAAIEPLMKEFAAWKGKLAASPANFRAAIEAQDRVDRLAEKVYSYAHLRSDENTADNSNHSRVDRLESLFASLTPLEAWFEPEVMAIPDARMAELLAAPELAFYRRSIEELLREKQHILPEREEELLGTLSEVTGSADKCFEMLNDADLTFGRIRDENGNSRELTHGSYLKFLESPDRAVRRRAFRRLYTRYRSFRNTFAATLEGAVKRHAVSAKIRHYPSALAASLSGDEIPETVYTDLIAAVRAKLPALFRCFELRRRILGVDRLEMYDIHTPLLAARREEYSFARAAELVRGALAPLGGDYLQNLERAFAERWIHAPEVKGKRSGAYSGGCYDSYPYVLLNFNGTLNDVFTLAHELGHSMHSFYSNHTQHFHYADYRIFVAEVASTVNETLLFEHLLKQAKSKEARAFLYGHFINEIRGTIYRQTMFAEFELAIHRLAEEGTPLTADTLCETYYKLNADYHGPGVHTDRLIELEWARIPHFYYNFYVYKYATGMSAALALAAGILSGDPAKRDAYLAFLKAGDTKPVLELLRDAGVDLATPQPVSAALDYFDSLVGKLGDELGIR